LEGRFITEVLGEPHADFALEEALLRLVKTVTIRVWRNSRAVIIGRAQLAELETDLEYCNSRRIPIVRRLTAGGAVYNGPGNVNWSFFLPGSFGSDGIRFTRNPPEVFGMISSVITKTLEKSGIRSWFEPPSGIVNLEGKICGMAAYISKDALLCHGTLLTHADLGEVSRLTTPVSRAAEKKYVRSKFANVANTGIRYETFAKSLQEVMKEGGILCAPGRLSREEIELGEKLLTERYSTDEWNLGDPFP